MPRNLRVFLTDDHPVVLDGLRMLVAEQTDMDVVGEAMDGESAIRQILALEPDVAVIDISLQGMNGIDVTSRLVQSRTPTRILTLTMHEDKGYVKRALSAGASGYVLKRVASEELIDAIRAVAAGGGYVDPAMQADVNNRSSGRNKGPLSQREEQVLRLIAQGYSNREIASQLSVSIKTVETYKARSLEKLNLDSRVHIIRYGITRGWL